MAAFSAFRTMTMCRTTMDNRQRSVDGNDAIRPNIVSGVLQLAKLIVCKEAVFEYVAHRKRF